MTINKFGTHIDKRHLNRVKKIEKQINQLLSNKVLLQNDKADVINAGKRRIVNMSTGIRSNDATTKQYVDSLGVYYTDLRNWPGSWISLHGKRAVNAADPIDARDLVNKRFLERHALCVLKTKTHGSNKYDAGSMRITNVSNPEDDQDVVTLSYLKEYLAKDVKN